MQNGYRFLTLLTRAHDASAPEHSEIVAFLRERQSRFPPPPPPPGASEEGDSNNKESEARRRAPAVPLLTRISAPGEKPVYKSTVRPRPLHELSGGVRKVPVLEKASAGHTFLRVGKPESRFLGSFLHRRGDARQRRITLIQELQDEHMTAAGDEERWEAELVRLARAEGLRPPLRGYGDEGGRAESYSSAVYLGIRYAGDWLTREMEDMFARARAMADIVEEERKLAEAEAKDRKRLRKRERATRKREAREEAERAERRRLRDEARECET